MQGGQNQEAMLEVEKKELKDHIPGVYSRQYLPLSTKVMLSLNTRLGPNQSWGGGALGYPPSSPTSDLPPQTGSGFQIAPKMISEIQNRNMPPDPPRMLYTHISRH